MAGNYFVIISLDCGIKIMSKDKMIDYLKRKLRYARKRSSGLKITMKDNLTKFGGWEIGYWCAYVSTLENMLDEIYGDDSWEKDL